MPTTTNYGFYSPPLTGVTPNVPRDTKTLADAVDAALKAEETARIAGDVTPKDFADRYQNAAQTVANNTVTAVDFDTAIAMSGITWDATAKEFVIARAGRYQVNAQVTFTPNATGLRLGYIHVNGGLMRRNGINGTTGAEVGLSLSKGLTLAVGDRIRISAFQTSGGNLSIVASNKQTIADVSYTGAAV